MSKDTIYRKDAIKALNREKSDWNCDYNVPIDNCIRRLNKVKSADRPQGEWIEMYRNGFGNMICMCSKCNFHATKSNFCPNCGADMGEREGE